MLKILSLHLAANFILPFLVSATFFVAFLLTFELFRVVQLMANQDVSIFFLLSLIGDIGVTLIPMAIPLALFFSTIFCLNKISSDSEYVAMRAAGMQKHKIYLPFLIISLLVSINVYFLSQQLVPNAHRSVRQKLKILSSTSIIAGIKSGQFFTNIPNVTLFPGALDETTKKLTDVFLHIEQDVEKVIFASHGQMIYSKNPKTGIESFKLLLQNGNMTQFDPGQERVEKILFDEYVLPISKQKFSYELSTKEIMMGKEELEDFIAEGPKNLESGEISKKDYFNAVYEYWNRWNISVICILFTFVGFGLGVTGNRGRGKNSSSRAIFILLIYYVIFFALVSQARDGRLSVWPAMLIPSLFLIFLGVKSYRNLDWVN